MSKDYTIGIYIRLSMADEDTGYGTKIESDSIGNQRMLINRYLDNHPVLSKYAHTTMTVDISWDISLGVDIADSSISFSLSPDVSQEMMAEGNHTFHYYDRYTWTA